MSASGRSQSEGNCVRFGNICTTGPERRIVFSAPIIDHLVYNRRDALAELSPAGQRLIDDFGAGSERPALITSWHWPWNSGKHPEVCLISSATESDRLQAGLEGEALKFFALPLHSTNAALKTNPPWPNKPRHILAIAYIYRYKIGARWRDETSQTYQVTEWEMIQWRQRRHDLLVSWAEKMKEPDFRQRIRTETEVSVFS
jgi:hypothetical protein